LRIYIQTLLNTGSKKAVKNMAKLSFDTSGANRGHSQHGKRRRRGGRSLLFVLGFLGICLIMFLLSFVLAFNWLGIGGAGGTVIDLDENEFLVNNDVLDAQIRHLLPEIDDEYGVLIINEDLLFQIMGILQARQSRIDTLEAQVERLEAMPHTTAAATGALTAGPPPQEPNESTEPADLPPLTIPNVPAATNPPAGTTPPPPTPPPPAPPPTPPPPAPPPTPPPPAPPPPTPPPPNPPPPAPPPPNPPPPNPPPDNQPPEWMQSQDW